MMCAHPEAKRIRITNTVWAVSDANSYTSDLHTISSLWRFDRLHRTYASNRLMFHLECLNSCSLCSTQSNSFSFYLTILLATLLYIFIRRLQHRLYFYFICSEFQQCHLLVSGKTGSFMAPRRRKHANYEHERQMFSTKLRRWTVEWFLECSTNGNSHHWNFLPLTIPIETAFCLSHSTCDHMLAHNCNHFDA